MRPNKASNIERSAGPTPSASACAAKVAKSPRRIASANVSRANACPLVMIEWEDSAQPIPNWTYLASFEPPGIILCASVGWMIRHDAELVALAPNMGAINDERSMQVSGVIQIPTRCVIQITRLDEPEVTSCVPVRASGPVRARKRQQSASAPASA